MARGWWDAHRALHKGHRGTDVSALQRKLIEDSGDRFPVTGVFDTATEKAVKEFQSRNDLGEDGIVGPITHSILFESNYRFQIHHPKLVVQAQWTCWAAAIESALASNWGHTRERLTVAEMLDSYKLFLAPRKDISIAGFDRLVRDIDAFQIVVDGKKLPLEKILNELGKNQSPIVLVHDLTGAVAHTVVIFGSRSPKGMHRSL